MVEKCVECGARIKVKVPKEIADVSGSLLCVKCAEKKGLPTQMDQLGLRLKIDEATKE